MAPLSKCPVCTADLTDSNLVQMSPGSDVDLGPAPEDARALSEWRRNDPRPHCPQKHPLPTDALSRDSLVVSFAGATFGGKSTMVRQIGHELARAALARLGVSAHLSTMSVDKWNDSLGEVIAATSAARRDDPRLDYAFELTDRSGGSPRTTNLLIFDCAGEDRTRDEGDTLRSRTPFLPLSDVVVFVLPPSGLQDLPDELRGGGRPDLVATEGWFREVTEWVRHESSAEHRREMVVVVALSKADRYLAHATHQLPRPLLDRRHLERPDAPLAATMRAEQAQLFEFVERAGGRALLDLAASINGTVFLTAVSGLEKDDLTGVLAPGMGTNRALDPIVIALMRRGIGSFGTTGSTR